MIGRVSRPPSRLWVWLLRLQYWFDRLSEPRRLLVGLACIAFLGACWLYLLGISSTLLLSRAEQEPEIEDLALSTEVLPAEIPATSAPLVVPPTLPPEPTRPPTATPAVERSDRLIEAPNVPDVPVVAVPRYGAPAPAATLKPRAVAPPAEAAQAAAEPTRVATRAAVIAPATATSVPVQPSPAPALPAAPPLQPAAPRQQQPPPTVRVVSTPTRAPIAPPVTAPTRAVVSTPAAPTLVPRTGAGPAAPLSIQTPTPRRAAGG